MRGRTGGAGVAVLVVVVVLGTALATIPTPLYPVYAREAGLDAFGITATFAAFALGAIAGLVIALLAATRLSRRRAYAVAAGLQAASALLLALDSGIPGFAAGRFVTGLGAGLLAASGTAFVWELALGLPPRTAAVLRSIAPALAFVGLGLGPTISALASPQDLAGVRAVFLVVGLGILLLLALSLWMLPAAAGRAIVSGGAGHRPRLPASAGLGAFAAFMTTGLFGSVTTLLLGELGVHDARATGAFAAAVFLSGAIGVVFLARRMGLVIAAVALAAGLVMVAIAVASTSLLLLLVAALWAGSAGGVLFARSLRVAVAAAPTQTFRQTVAVFLCAYAGLAVPVLGLGLLARAAGTSTAVGAFVALGAGVCLVAATADAFASRRSENRREIDGRVSVPR